MTGSQCRLPGTDDRFRRNKIRFTDFHVHDGTALRLQFPCPAQQCHDMERLDVAHAMGNGHGIGTLGASTETPIVPKPCPAGVQAACSLRSSSTSTNGLP